MRGGAFPQIKSAKVQIAIVSFAARHDLAADRRPPNLLSNLKRGRERVIDARGVRRLCRS
jgi:hypothetical protein